MITMSFDGKVAITLSPPHATLINTVCSLLGKLVAALFDQRTEKADLGPN